MPELHCAVSKPCVTAPCSLVAALKHQPMASIWCWVPQSVCAGHGADAVWRLSTIWGGRTARAGVLSAEAR